VVQLVGLVELVELVEEMGDLVALVQAYILRALEEAGPGMKVMLLDAETTPTVSLAFAQSALMRQEVFLFERVQEAPSQEDLRHLKCLAILRPDQESLRLLAAELASPRYGAYHLHFTNLLPKAAVKQLAEADMQEVVKEVREIYIDFLPIGSHLFGLSLASPLQPLGSRWVEGSLARTGQALASLLLGLRLNPTIRYQEGSGPAAMLAQALRATVAREAAMFAGEGGPVVLVLDRREDPVTPLLTQWTYQAMVHQLLGITNNRVSLAGAPGVGKELQEVMLSSSQDEFYAANLYSNFGEIGATIKLLMEDFQNKAKSHQKIDSIADMKNFVESYPQFKKMSGTVSKHVTLVSELSRLISKRNLLKVSELEQELVAGGDLKEMVKEVSEMVQDERTSLDDAMRLVMLFALRFETSSSSSVRSMTALLRRRGGEREARLVQSLQRHAGANARKGDLFAEQNSSTKNLTGKLFKGLKGVENVYTQHSPLLKQLAEDVVRGKLRAATFPSLTPTDTSRPAATVIVFVIGGFTYQEAHAVYQLNSQLGAQVLLGGTSVLNSAAFVEQVEASYPPQQA